MSDNVYHPNHYKVNSVKLEPIELTGRLPSLVGQAVNYVIRARYKGNFEEDIEKAINCLCIQNSFDDMFQNGTGDTKVLKVDGGYTKTMMQIFRKHYMPVTVPPTEDGSDTNWFELKFLRALITPSLQITNYSIVEALKVLEDVRDGCYVP